jgi:hypothetical protein
VNDTVGTVTAIELLAPTCLTTEQTGGINRTINPDAVIGHNMGPPMKLDCPSWVVCLPSGLASLAVVAHFYAGFDKWADAA